MQPEKEWLSSVSQTLTIPLLTRARESQSENPLFRDEKAVALLHSITGDMSITHGGVVADHGILARTVLLDQEIRGHLDREGQLTVINLGAGLDTRAARLRDSRIQWWDLDLPDVITLRQQLFEQNERGICIAASALEPSWPDRLSDTNGRPVVLVAEGLLMYFTKNDVRSLFGLLAERFPGATLYFDAVHTNFVGKGTTSPFLWGVQEPQEIPAMDDRLRVEKVWYTGNLLPQRQPWLLRCLNMVPATRKRSMILRIRIGGGR